jgi:hypothetical protein
VGSQVKPQANDFQTFQSIFQGNQMSRLESFIRRMQAQRDILNQVADLISDVPGPVLEIGLGNGRTYDHLREILPEREIYVFDRAVNAHPSCIPDDEYLFLGEVDQTLLACHERTGSPAALIHSDIGIGDPEGNVLIGKWLSPMIDKQTQSGGIVVCNLELSLPGFSELPLPPGIQKGRYFVYQKHFS